MEAFSRVSLFLRAEAHRQYVHAGEEVPTMQPEIRRRYKRVRVGWLASRVAAAFNFISGEK